MNLKKQLLAAFIISLICVIFFALISLLVSNHNIMRFDNLVIAVVQGTESPTLTSIMKFFTFVGSAPFVIPLCVCLLFFLFKVLHHRQELILFSAVIAGAAILNGILKHFFHRMRPDLHRLIEVSGYSFPSGHAMSAFAVYGVLAFLLWRHIPVNWGRGLLIIFSTFMILMIGVSRIYLGVHYPSDIIGGYLASGCWLAAAIWFFQKSQEKRFNRQSKRMN